MRYGDFIITPSWTFHDHGNDGADPVVWLDGLDIPLVRFLDAGFAEKSGVKSQADARPEGDALHRYGSNMLPLDHAPMAHEPSRVFIYPFARTREALAGIARGRADPHFGFKQRFVNPATGRSPMPTIGTFAQRLPAGFETRPYRSSDSTVHVCLEGSGRATIGRPRRFDFGRRDIFVVPSWQPWSIAAPRRHDPLQLLRSAGAAGARPLARGAARERGGARPGHRRRRRHRRPRRRAGAGAARLSRQGARAGRARSARSAPASSSRPNAFAAFDALGVGERARSRAVYTDEW